MKSLFKKKIFLITFSLYLSLIIASFFIYFFEYKKNIYTEQRITDYCEKNYFDCEKKNLKYFFLDERTKNPDLSIYAPPIHSTRIKKFVEKEVFPFSGVSNSKTLICNESGKYVFITSDRYGFNNLDNIWDKSIDVTLVGDSFTFGECVNFNETITSNLLKANYNTVSLGYGSNGPLITLGSIREFGSLIKSKKVFWIFFAGNDLEDLSREKKSKLLIKYLDPNFSQGLLNKKKFIDKVYSDYFESENEKLKNSWPYKFSLIKIFDLSIVKIFLKNYFNNYQLSNSERKESSDKYRVIDNYDFDLFSKIIETANKEVKSWGGELSFVYISSPQVFHSKDYNLENKYQRDKVKRIVHSHDLEFIEIENKIIESKIPIDKIYSLGMGHFIKNGYKIVSTEIINFLNKAK